MLPFKNPIGQENGFDGFGDITHYQDGTKSGPGTRWRTNRQSWRRQ
jgi:hypothetical protein